MNETPDLAIWVLENDPGLRSVITYLAKQEGLPVVETDSLRTAETLLLKTRASGEAPLGVLSGLRLYDGFTTDFLLECKRVFPEVQVCCIASVPEPEIATRLQEGGVAVLGRSISLHDLLEILSKTKVH